MLFLIARFDTPAASTDAAQRSNSFWWSLELISPTDSQSVRRLAEKIRNLLDAYNELETIQSPLQLAAENLRDTKKNDRIQLALAEQHSSKLM